MVLMKEYVSEAIEIVTIKFIFECAVMSTDKVKQVFDITDN